MNIKNLSLSKSLSILLVGLMACNAYGFFEQIETSNSVQIDGFSRVYYEQHSEAGYADIGLVQTVQGRLMHESKLTDRTYIDAHYVLAWDTLLYKNSGDVPEYLSFNELSKFGPSERAYRSDDLKQSHAVDNKNRLLQNLDRLVLHHAFEWGDLHLGRQAITLGISRFSQQSDVLYPVSFNNLQSDYRQGVDAMRFELPMGILSVLDMAWVQSENAERSVGFLRFKSNMDYLEYEITGMQLNDDALLTLSLQQSLNSVGLWQELTLLNDENKKNRTYHRLTIGLDNTVSDFLISAEYYYNELGSEDPIEYSSKAAEFNLYNKNAITFFAQQYVFIGANYLEGSQNNMTMNYALNLNDKSQLVSMVFNHNINERWDANLQANLPLSTGYNSDRNLNAEFSQYFHSLSLNLSAIF